MGELIDKAKGRLRRIFGAITGDRGEEVRGAIDEKKGEVKGRFEDVKHDFKHPRK